MINYRTTNHVKFNIAALFLLLSVVAVISGCGGNDHKYDVSGRVTAGGSALSGVTVTLSGDSSKIATTDANGRYKFSGLSEGKYVLTPSLAGYMCTPPKKDVYPNYRDVTGFDFSCSDQVRISAANHTVYLKSDGTVWTWGNNGNGQLGDGTTTDKTSPVQATGLSGAIKAIAAGDAHTVALMNDDTVWTWGSNSNGQLGDGTTDDKSTPVQVTGLSGVIKAIAAGDAHTVALMNDDTVWTWGNNSDGQLGDDTKNDKTTPVKVDISNVTAIAAGDAHTVALKKDGTVWAWGSNSDGQLGDGTTNNRSTPVLVSEVSDATAIAAGGTHTAALKDGKVRTWGNNSNGQLGNGTTNDKDTSVEVNGLSDVTAIAAGDAHTVALKKDGTVWTWGNNSNGQLGDGTTTDKTSPVQVNGLSDVTAIAAGNTHTAALKIDASSWTWGNNSTGQLGNGTTTDTWTPIPVQWP
jgi:alpha-tubulin suppressor-like RCC1 family protein